MKENNIGVYKLILGDEIYIGSSRNLYARKHNHFCSLRHHSHVNANVQRLYDTVGEENAHFEVIEYCAEADLRDREEYYIELLKPTLNICPTAYDSTGYKHTNEAKVIMSEKAKGTKRCVGRYVSPETRKKISMKQKEYVKRNGGLNKNFYETFGRGKNKKRAFPYEIDKATDF